MALSTLSDEAIEAHILPVLAHSSPISIGRLFDARCEYIFNQHNIVYTGNIITPTADINTAKLIINVTISTPGARYL